ncbi:MAG TPA: hypothetical protein PLO62_11475 [Candidatus Hydrogenedentes bacterium]|nr:hypothetical protein [Candidatus Hydrogenedentota bacterium]HOS01980.1 hypothetical protein [Candidatus Hydrogenedentota bacterium]
MLKRVAMVGVSVLLCACQRTPNEVLNKVMYDFGVGEKPEGYVSPSDKLMERLRGVGEAEMKRMNMAARQGEIKFQSEGNLKGQYYREVKNYESFSPLEATAGTQTAGSERGYFGYIQFRYHVYQSPRKANRTEAAAEPAIIKTGVTGAETYRYSFSSGGAWDGQPGTPADK